jgi:Zn-dependent protease with chaperone function
MTASPTAPYALCPNGHSGPFRAGSLFCPQCGLLLTWVDPGAPAGIPGIPPPPDAPPPAAPAPGAAPAPALPVAPPPPTCETCHDSTDGIPDGALLCPGCRRLRPLAPGYALDAGAFHWSLDGSAMAKLRSITPLNKAASAISDKVGRPWIESSFNAVRLGDSQMPHVFRLAVLAARLLALPHMPDVYISGDRIWDAATYGSDRSTFIVLGTALAGNFRDRELLFILAREMGHCRAGHALWKTVIRVLLGDMGPRKGLAGAGLLSALNPFHLVEGAIELPLLAWARQAEITADRAGALAVGSADIAERALMTWSLKSAMLLRSVNVDAWLQQLDDDDEQVSRLSEVVSSSTPYITRRLKLMIRYFQSPDTERWCQRIAPLREAALPAAAAPAPGPSARPATKPRPARPVPPIPAPEAGPSGTGGQSSAPPGRKTSASDQPPAGKGGIRLSCPACRAPLRIPAAAAAGKEVLRIRCANAGCGKVMEIKLKR